MSHSTEQLLFAAKVRDLAVTLRHSAYQPAYEAWESSQPTLEARRHRPQTEEEHALNRKHAEKAEAEQAFKQKWHTEHPVRNYTKQALDLIQEIADEIHKLRG